MGSKSESLRAWARLGRVGVDGRAQGLERPRGVAGPGLGGGQAVEHVLVLGMQLGGLLEGLERVGVLAAVVEVHAVVEEVLEALGTGRALLAGPLADGL